MNQADEIELAGGEVRAAPTLADESDSALKPKSKILDSIRSKSRKKPVNIPPPCDFDEASIPPEVLYCILRCLDNKTFINCAVVSRRWRDLIVQSKTEWHDRKLLRETAAENGPLRPYHPFFVWSVLEMAMEENPDCGYRNGTSKPTMQRYEFFNCPAHGPTRSMKKLTPDTAQPDSGCIFRHARLAATMICFFWTMLVIEPAINRVRSAPVSNTLQALAYLALNMGLPLHKLNWFLRQIHHFICTQLLMALLPVGASLQTASFIIILFPYIQALARSSLTSTHMESSLEIYRAQLRALFHQLWTVTITFLFFFPSTSTGTHWIIFFLICAANFYTISHTFLSAAPGWDWRMSLAAPVRRNAWNVLLAIILRLSWIFVFIYLADSTTIIHSMARGAIGWTWVRLVGAMTIGLFSEAAIHIAEENVNVLLEINEELVRVLIRDVIRWLCPCLFFILSSITIAINGFVYIVREFRVVSLVSVAVSNWFPALVSVILTILSLYLASIGHRIVRFHAGKLEIFTDSYWESVARECPESSRDRRFFEYLARFLKANN